MPRQKGQTYDTSSNAETIAPPPSERPLTELLAASTQAVLHELLTNEPELARRIGPALYHSISTRQLSRYEQQYLYSKLVSLVDQIRLLNGEVPQVLSSGEHA